MKWWKSLSVSGPRVCGVCRMMRGDETKGAH